MSDKNVLDEFLNCKPSGGADVLPLPTQPRGETAGNTESEEPELIERRAFGIGRGRRQPFMLDVRKMDLQRLALSYSHLTRAAFDPSGIIVLEFSGYLVHIEGRHLQRVYENLLLQNVMYVQEENPEIERNVPADETFISKIEIGEL